MVEKYDALILYHLKADPDTMCDRKWAAAAKGLEWAREEESKRNNEMNERLSRLFRH